MGLLPINFPSLFPCLLLLILYRGVSGTEFTFINRCDHTIWPGILGNSRLDSTGFELSPGASRAVHVPPGWSGRLWGRTGCTFDPTTGQGNCLTADCGSNQVECNGAGATPPATLAEFTIGSGSAQDFYDVSLVDGYNIQMIVDASGGSGACLSTGCVTDLNRQCPEELRTGNGKACKSACEAFGNPEYCCSGAYSSNQRALDRIVTLLMMLRAHSLVLVQIIPLHSALPQQAKNQNRVQIQDMGHQNCSTVHGCRTSSPETPPGRWFCQ